jgi:cytochrome c biogenesis protein CcdA/thiol-disulfide isomerase/thioredoxin
MNTLNILLALVEGIRLNLTPCILPILPLVLAASLDDGKRRPFGVVTGFVLIFILLALFSRRFFAAVPLDPAYVKVGALVLLVLFGIMMLSGMFYQRVPGPATEEEARYAQDMSYRWGQEGGFVSGLALGALIGLIWTPCGGPLMVSALAQLRSRTDPEAVSVVVMFAVGAGIPMLVVAWLMRWALKKWTRLSEHGDMVRRFLGALIILFAAVVFIGADKRFLPDATRKAVTERPRIGGPQRQPSAYRAPDLAPGDWLNSRALNLGDLRGKAVVLDFWSASCRECLGAVEKMKEWDAKYRDKGLVIIGVHSPQNEAEKSPKSVKRSVDKLGIRYPVALDNESKTLGNYKISSRPSQALIDKEGRVVYTHSGHQDYGTFEDKIRGLLSLPKEMKEPQPDAEAPPPPVPPQVGLPSQPKELPPVPPKPEPQPKAEPERPERGRMAVGFDNAGGYVGQTAIKKSEALRYEQASDIPMGKWSLMGRWRMESDRIISEKSRASLRFRFKASRVSVVMGTADEGESKVSVFLNDKPVGKFGGKDAPRSNVYLKGHSVYEIVAQPEAREGVLDIVACAPGVEVYLVIFSD